MSEHRIPIVQDYDIRSEGPITPWLRLIVPDGKISHYAEGEGLHGHQRLLLYWSHAKGSIPLLSTIMQRKGGGEVWTGPPVDILGASIDTWLSVIPYPDPPDCDGSVHKGWRLSNMALDHGYTEFFVEPHWQEYHK